MSKRVLRGVVVSDACEKTVIVRVERRVMHPIYKKFVTHSKKYAAHDENNSYRSGDVVRIEESRPTLEAFCRYADDQGVTHRRMTVEELFPREVQGMARI